MNPAQSRSLPRERETRISACAQTLTHACTRPRAHARIDIEHIRVSLPIRTHTPLEARLRRFRYVCDTAACVYVYVCHRTGGIYSSARDGRTAACAFAFVGVTWTNRTSSAPWAARSQHTSVIDTAGAIYVIGGRYGYFTVYNDVWKSIDGGADRTRGCSGVLDGYSGGTRGYPRGILGQYSGQLRVGTRTCMHAHERTPKQFVQQRAGKDACAL